MNINKGIVYIMVIFMVIGALDKMFGNKWGYGKQFEQGFMAMGPLALAMLGIVSLAPVIAWILRPILLPVYSAIGADPAMFAGTFLALDMGGYSLAMELAETEEAGLFSGLILGSMMGATIVFTIPVALNIIEKKDYTFLAKGVLAGIITIPLGCFVGGITAGFELSMILRSLTPIILVAGLIAFGLWRTPEKMIAGFDGFGKGVIGISMIGLIAGIVEEVTGLVVIPGMLPITEGIEIVGSIAIILAGAFPMVYFIKTTFQTPLMKLGRLLGMGDVAAAGMISSLANNIAMFGMMKDMDENGKVLNAAFAVGGAFVFGGQLGFIAGVNEAMIVPVVVGKLVAGITAIAFAKRLMVMSSAKPRQDMI
ncbi:ethanolamine utilization protein EutH [Clostridiaceae bacterium 35-E11]